MNINIQNTNTETILLKDLVQQKRIEMKRGNVISKTTGQYPVYSSSVQNNGLMCYSDDYMFDEELISWSIDGGGDFFYRPKHKYSLTNVSGYIRVLDKNINCKYLYCVLDLLHSKEHFDYTTKAHPSVICKMYKVPLPNIEVQKKIATILFTMEDLINEEQSTITKLKETKQSLLQLLFPSNNSNFPQLRFKNFTSPWEQRKLDDMCEIITKQTGFDYSATIKPSLVTESSNDTYSFIQNKDFSENEINLDTDFYIPIEVAERFPKILLDKPSLLISISGRIGNIGFYNFPHKSFIGGAVGICKLRNSQYGEFIVQELESDYGQNYFHSLIKASSHANITVEDIRNINILMPKDDCEQKKIASYFSHINHLITLHQCKLKKYKEIKSALLDKLLV